MMNWPPHHVDELLMFRPLSQGDVSEIAKLQLHMLPHKLEEKDIHLMPSEELIAHYLSRLSGISTAGFDPHSDTYRNGARPIKRMIQKELLNELSKQIIAGTLETVVPQVIDPAARDKLCSMGRSCCGSQWMSRR